MFRKDKTKTVRFTSTAVPPISSTPISGIPSDSKKTKLTPIEDLKTRVINMNDHYDKLGVFIFTTCMAAMLHVKTLDDRLAKIEDHLVKMQELLQTRSKEQLSTDLSMKVIDPKVIDPKVMDPKVIDPKVIDPNNLFSSMMNFESKQ